MNKAQWVLGWKGERDYLGFLWKISYRWSGFSGKRNGIMVREKNRNKGLSVGKERVNLKNNK